MGGEPRRDPRSSLCSACWLFHQCRSKGGMAFYDQTRHQPPPVSFPHTQTAPRRAALHRAPPPPRPPAAYGATGSNRTHSFDVQVLSHFPRAYYLREFLSADSAAALANAALPRMTASTLALKPGERAEDVADVRTSRGTFMTHDEDATGVLWQLEHRVAALTHIPWPHGESWNILSYENGAHYDAHYDSFDEKVYGTSKSQRVATVLVYLTDVEGGGETCFPLEGEGGVARKSAPGFAYKDCAGLVVGPPRAGDALLFYSAHPNNTLDAASLHGGCPVTRGRKFVATKWLRNNQVAEFG